MSRRGEEERKNMVAGYLKEACKLLLHLLRSRFGLVLLLSLESIVLLQAPGYKCGGNNILKVQ